MKRILCLGFLSLAMYAAWGCDSNTSALPCDRAIASLLAANDNDRIEQANEIYARMKPECVVLLRNRMISAGPKIWAFASAHPELVDEGLFRRALASGNADAIEGALMAFHGDATTEWAPILDVLHHHWSTYGERSKRAALSHFVIFADCRSFREPARKRLAELLVRAAESDDEHMQRLTYAALKKAFDLNDLQLVNDGTSQENRIARSMEFLRERSSAVDQLTRLPPRTEP